MSLPSRSDRRDRMALQASLTGIKIEFVDGVVGGDVPDKVIPTTSDRDRLGDGDIGCWRGHMNAIRE